jgi:hypothetical protein
VGRAGDASPTREPIMYPPFSQIVAMMTQMEFFYIVTSATAIMVFAIFLMFIEDV